MPIGDRLKRRLFRRGVDHQQPIVLTLRRIFIMPTASGLLFAVVLFVMLLGAINYDLALGHALVFLLAGIGLVSMVHTARNLLTLRLTAGRADPVFAGQLARFTVQLENDRSQARCALEFAFGKHGTVSIDVAAGGLTNVAIPCPAPHRGRLDPGRITVSTRYPLGFFRAWSHPHPPLSCLIYPQPISTPLPPASAIANDRQCHGGNSNDGQQDFTGLRLRQPNDSPRHIAWKAVARDIDHRPLLVKEFGGGAAPELWLDGSLIPTEVTLETRLSLLAGWVLAAEPSGAPYGLRLPGLTIEPGQGEAHRDVCLEALALYGQR